MDDLKEEDIKRIKRKLSLGLDYGEKAEEKSRGGKWANWKRGGSNYYQKESFLKRLIFGGAGGEKRFPWYSLKRDRNSTIAAICVVCLIFHVQFIDIAYSLVNTVRLRGERQRMIDAWDEMDRVWWREFKVKHPDLFDRKAKQMDAPASEIHSK